MLGRLSSFSGPLSKLFTTIKGFTLNGLILRYELRDRDSYTGTSTLIDLIGSSNATLTNGPTYSSNGYLNFDGSNDYLITNTSLNSKLSPPNTSRIISVFVWTYPMDNGVIINEQGTSILDSFWFDSQLEIVSGTLKFRVWPSLSGFSSTIPISFNKWYYLGFTYDGTTLRGYVNGQLAGSLNLTRQTPYNEGSGSGLYYALASTAGTNLGDGTNSKLKLGAFHVYNTALTSQQVLNNYNTQKSNYIHTDNLLIWIDANDPQSFSGGNIFDISGNYFTHSIGPGTTSSVVNGIKCFDCNSLTNAYIRVNGTGPVLSTSGYTYVAWARISPTSSNYRTLYRSAPNDHALLVNVGTDNLGFYDNDSASFKDSGYDVTLIENKWVQYSVVGDSSSSIFYINDVQVGSVAFGAGGNRHDYFGSINEQPFGYIGNMMLYNTKLSQAQIKQNYDALKHVYNPELVTDGLLLRLDANDSYSYPGSGATWSDISGNENNMILKNSPTYVSSSISYFDFNGTTQYAQGTGITVPTTAYTKSVWFWIDAYADNNIVSGGNGTGGHFMFMGSSSFTKIFVGHQNQVPSQAANFLAYQSTASISLNTWYNVTVTFNTTNGFKIYINGQLDSSHNMTLAHLGSGTTNLGSYADSGGNYLNGRISKVYTYNRVLDANEVLQNFNADRTTFGI